MYGRLGEAATLVVQMDDVYKEFYDVYPLECTANDYPVITQGCSSFPNTGWANTKHIFTYLKYGRTV